MTFADGQDETILRVATQLFAALGYDGTSAQEIADAAGLDVATVNRVTGGKRELYLAVMGRAHDREHAAIEQAVAKAAGPDAAATIHGVIDSYVDFCAANPDVVSLWMHRWLSDAADMTELEQRYARPLVKLLLDSLKPYMDQIDSGVDMRYAVQTVIWLVNAFGRGGVVNEEGQRLGFDDPETLRRFRAHLHLLVHRMLLLP
ncbi:TetR/AcrR family transcriptional regulator [Streptosporangium sp. KLBMP 9127]|nr:TetR/AcrR family transcriptional regulator [Streptosporangium sp. KLBMP 9127]